MQISRYTIQIKSIGKIFNRQAALIGPPSTPSKNRTGGMFENFSNFNRVLHMKLSVPTRFPVAMCFWLIDKR